MKAEVSVLSVKHIRRGFDMCTGIEGPLLAKIAIGSAVASTAASVYTGEKARSAQKKTMRRQEAKQRAQSARDAMAQVRQQRIAQSQILQGAATQGTMQSSAAQGGYSAVGALTSGNMQFLNQMDSFNSRISQSMQTSQRYSGQANTYSSLANLALTGYGMTDGIGGGTDVKNTSPVSGGGGSLRTPY